jgi:hypothetical protein
MLEKTIFLLLIIVTVCHGLYFHIAETERKCFIEEIPDETTGELFEHIISCRFNKISLSDCSNC